MKRKLQHLTTLIACLSILSMLLAACGGEAAAPTAVPTADTGSAQPTNTTAAMPAGTTPTTGAMTDAGDVVWISTQFTPVEESERLRNTILKDFKGKVEYVPQDPGPFNDRIMAENKTGKVTVSLVGGLHGDFPPL